MLSAMSVQRLQALWPPKQGAQRTVRRVRHSGFKFAAETYQRRNPSVPWMPQSAVEILSDMLPGGDRCLEWGSGASTTWLASRCASIVSAEHDRDWSERVRTELTQQGADPNSVRLLSLEPSDRPAESPYVRVIDEFEPGQLDVCFVDGEHRATCVLESIPKLASGGLLIVDDSQAFLDHPSRCTYSRQGLGPVDDDWRRVSQQVEKWRLVWTGDGYSDAAIWIKP
jgi:predicted O-methyltransferase YrrM